MKTFMSIADLDRLADDDPAKPVVRQFLEWLIADGEFPDHPYDPDDHGYIALVEPGDENRELDDIDMPRLTEILWEGVSIIDGFCHAVYLGAGDYGIGFGREHLPREIPENRLSLFDFLARVRCDEVTHNPLVPGSSPGGPTIPHRNHHLMAPRARDHSPLV